VLLGDSIILEKSVLEEKKKQEYLGVEVFGKESRERLSFIERGRRGSY